jgi:hypothetical protein
MSMTRLGSLGGSFPVWLGDAILSSIQCSILDLLASEPNEIGRRRPGISFAASVSATY